MTLVDAGLPPKGALELVKAQLETRLKDPESARVKLVGNPRPVVFAKTSFHPGGAGWEICASVNAKNSFGAYTGYKNVFLLWNSGWTVMYIDGDVGSAYCNENNNFRLLKGDRQIVAE